MPGWTVGDNFHNNIAYAPGTWIALHRICEKHGVGDQFRVHYDPSHAILMGQDTRSIFQYLKDAGYDFIIGGFHVKGQVIDSKGVAAWGYGGQTVERGDWIETASRRRTRPISVNAWKKQTVLCEHELPGTAKHDPLGYLQNRTVDWLDHQLAARELLKLDVANTALVIEHEYPRARIQDKERLEADPEGLDRLRAQDRRGRRLHVRAAPRGAAGAGHPRAGARARRLLDLTEDDDGEAQAERRDDRLRLHGSRAFERLAPGRRASFRTLPFEPVLKVVVGRTEAKVKEAAGAPRLRGARDELAGGDRAQGHRHRRHLHARRLARADRHRRRRGGQGDPVREAARQHRRRRRAHERRRQEGGRRQHGLPQLPPLPGGGAGQAAHRRRARSATSTTTAALYLQDWIVDPEVPARLAAGEGAGRARDRSATSCRTRWICRATWSASRSRSRAC